MSNQTFRIYTGMGKSNDWAALGLTKEQQEHLDTIGYSGSFGEFTTFEEYLNSINPDQQVYTVQKIRENNAEFTAEYAVSVFEKPSITVNKVSVIGVVKNNDSRFENMKAAYYACKNAGIDVPDEVRDYFKGKEPQENNMQEVSLDKKISMQDDYYEIKVQELQGIESIRIVLPKNA